MTTNSTTYGAAQNLSSVRLATARLMDELAREAIARMVGQRT